MSLVPSFLPLLQPFFQQMTAPTYASLLTVLAGWIVAHGQRRTVTGALVATDALDEKHFSAYHRVFSAARWSLDAVGLGLLGLILTLALASGATVFLVIDDTVCRKAGGGCTAWTATTTRPTPAAAPRPPTAASRRAATAG